MITLASVFERCRDRQIHWLKIDVEGFEESVLAGWRPAVERPWILVIESVRPGTREDVSARWEAGLADLGYRHAYFDGLNRFYIEQSHAELATAFSCGPNVFDDFALSGTASAPFCAVLGRRLAADHEAYRCALEAQRLELTQYAENLRAAHEADRAAWALEQTRVKEYVKSLQGWGRTSEEYAKSLEQERGRIYAIREAERIAMEKERLENGQRIANLESEHERLRAATGAAPK